MNSKLTRKVISSREAAMLYGFSEGTLANLRCGRKGPKFYKRGRKVLYLITDFEQWLTECPIETMDSIEGRGS